MCPELTDTFDRSHRQPFACTTLVLTFAYINTSPEPPPQDPCPFERPVNPRPRPLSLSLPWEIRSLPAAWSRPPAPYLAKRMECVQLAGAFRLAGASKSWSRLRALPNASRNRRCAAGLSFIPEGRKTVAGGRSAASPPVRRRYASASQRDARGLFMARASPSRTPFQGACAAGLVAPSGREYAGLPPQSSVRAFNRKAVA